jgi:AraC-like DNA-binding protein
LVNRILQQQAVEQLDRLAERSGSFLNRLERLLKGQLDRGDVTLASLASELNMSPRTLQNRLEASGMSFRSVVDRVRQSEAESYLRESRLPLIDIALALGFANQTSFQHAFKRWTGKSPGEFRRQS